MIFFRKKILAALFLLPGIMIFTGGCKREPVVVIQRSVRSAEDIAPIDSHLVKPYDYANVVSLEDLPVEVKKKKFIDLILPAVLVARERYARELERVDSLSAIGSSEMKREDREFIDEKMKYLGAKNIEQLKLRLHTHPNSIVLAQAALESGWGTSRFFMEANNIFGIHSFDRNHSRIRAGRKRGGETSYLKKYPVLSESVDDYFRTIARGPYRDFRVRRTITEDVYTLIRYLENYSIMGEAYIFLLEEVIRANDLTQYDHYRIDPRYLN